MPAIASLEDLRAAQKELPEVKDVEELKRVFRRWRKIVEELNRDWESYFVIEITDGLIRFAGDIAERYLLRGFDAIHLASAVHLKNKINSEIYFSSHDTRLNQSAEKEGMIIVS